jgi:uncharacterized protein (TIGR02594 family)
VPTIASLVSNKILKLGMAGPDVRELQLALGKLGYPLKGSGYFGIGTDTAVSSFQRKAGLDPDGDVGTATAQAIDAALAGPKPGTGRLAPPVVEARPLWLEAGLGLVGTAEKAGAGNNADIMQWADQEGGAIDRTYTADSIPWCALFIGHILTLGGQKGTGSLWALDYADPRKWSAVKLIGPAVGAIAPMVRAGGGHVICVVGRDQHGNIMGLGGNQSDKVSIIPFPPSRLNRGFWWPGGASPPASIGFSSLPVVRSDGKVSSKES